MTVLRNILMMLFGILALYTVVVIWRDGLGWAPVFFGDLLSLTWRGQFNLDFSGYLIVSALWLAWRSGFSAGGIAVALAASVLGMMVFAPAVLMIIRQSNGDMAHLLLGAHKA